MARLQTFQITAFCFLLLIGTSFEQWSLDDGDWTSESDKDGTCLYCDTKCPQNYYWDSSRDRCVRLRIKDEQKDW
ncbi:hypothetical protein CHUAL_003190 [Chamberlinius hualienensis]